MRVGFWYTFRQMLGIVCRSNALLDVDSSARLGSQLWDDDAEDSVLQARFHRILVDTGREAEATMKFSNAAL